MKEIFKTIQDIFNNKYIKALYFTIFIQIIFIGLLLLINIAPFVMLILGLSIASSILVYKAVLVIIN